MRTTRKKPRAVTVQVHGKVEELAAHGWGGVAIHAELGRLGLLDDEDRPDVRTIQRLVRDLTPPDEVMESEAWRLDHEPWQLGSAEPEDAAVVLRVAADLLSTAVPWPTVGLARWIGRLHAAVPDLIEQDGGPFELWRLATVFQSRADRGEPTMDLDQYLACAPWRDGGAAYIATIQSGRVTTVHGGKFTPEGAFEALIAKAIDQRKKADQ